MVNAIPSVTIKGFVVFGLMSALNIQAQSPPAPAPAFEVASIKPNHSADRGVSIMNAPGGRFVAKNVSLKMLIRLAYKVQDFQITGGPSWINSERFDVEAKPESAGNDDIEKLTDNQRDALVEQQRLRVQALLAERFKLVFHRQTKETSAYALVVAKNGPKLQEASAAPSGPDPADAQAPKGPAFKGRGMRMGRGELSGQSAPLSMLAEGLSNQLGRTVVDKTGLKGIYDFTLKWTPDESQGQTFKGPGDGGEPHPSADSAPPPEGSGPTVFTALEEQLGLKLESQKGPVEILCIDQVEKPSEN
jgi:uncharacterized protein (TIGR03435 family)